MAKETAWSQIKKEHQSFWSLRNGEDNTSWPETALAATQHCSDSGRRDGQIDGLVSVPRREQRCPVFARCSPVAALIFSAHRSQAKMNSTTTASTGWLRHTSHTIGTRAEFGVLDLC